MKKGQKSKVKDKDDLLSQFFFLANQYKNIIYAVGGNGQIK